MNITESVNPSLLGRLGIQLPRSKEKQNKITLNSLRVRK
jgi:hypothetical protein